MESVSDKVRSIVERHFDEEIEYKKAEVELINDRIHSVKQILDNLRAAIISKYYAVPDYVEVAAGDNCVHPTVRAYFAGKTLPSAILNSVTYDLPVKLGRGHLEDQKPSKTKHVVKSMEKVKFVIGNVSRYIGDEDPDDIVTHIWVTYVRLHPSENLRIQDIVSKVRFFLHPSYFPHDVVDVTSPFQLKRKGWGEFSLRSQLHFIDPLNKPVDVIHGLKLDKFKTGLQTFGSETVFEVMLLVEKEADLPTKPEIAVTEQTRQGVEIKREPLDRIDAEKRTVANADVKKEISTEPIVIDLEAHGHDYCIPIKPQPIAYLHVSESPPETTCPDVRVIPGESVLKSKCLTPTQSVQLASALEAAANWDESIRKIDFSQDIYRLIDILAQSHFTLIGPRLVADLSYQAPSSETFFSYAIGKRRAVEWARASSLRQSLIKYQANDVPKTRTILLYLRKNGYTPLHECTQLVPAKLDGVKFDSYSLIDLSARIPSDHCLQVSSVKKRKNWPEEDVDIDIISVQTEQTEDLRRDVANNEPHLHFVFDTFKEIIDDHRLPADEDDLDALLRVTNAAIMSFAGQLLRRSLAEAFDRNSSNFVIDGILPTDIHSAVRAHEVFDFLGNAGLAVRMDSAESLGQDLL